MSLFGITILIGVNLFELKQYIFKDFNVEFHINVKERSKLDTIKFEQDLSPNNKKNVKREQLDTLKVIIIVTLNL